MIGAFRKIFSKSKKSVDPPPNPKPSKNPPPPQVSQATLEKLRKAKAQIKQSEVEETPSTSPPETQAPNAVSTAVATPQAKPEPPSPVPSASPRPVTAPPSAVQPNPVSVPEDLEDTLGIPFGTILDRLPESVQNDPGMAQAGSEEINIPKFKVFEKLAEGKILFTLKELIQWAPTTSISSMEELGSTQIEFPIKDILSRLDLKTLPRRKNQRKTEVPKGIEPSFGPRGIAPGKSEHSAGAPPLNPTPSPVPETQTTTESKKTSSDPEPQNKSSLDAFRIKPNETTKVSSAKQSTPELKKTSPS
ncbi:MAG TPA: hypothetical protein EYQ50_01205, partial [Verrucomicrobiales bacterium]|nr:hypothetical protein [Verrucomicrobiales bacterium]HIL68615.1 hypothetical protein [Verrucomicrobiota bacterium]